MFMLDRGGRAGAEPKANRRDRVKEWNSPFFRNLD